VHVQKAGASVEARDMHGNTPLHEAAKGSASSMITALLKHDASLDAVNDASETPLHVAARGKTVQMVTTIIRAGGKVRPRPQQASCFLDEQQRLLAQFAAT
jgi:ankyrin repeat protein